MPIAPFVSVCVPTYNRPGMVEQLISSFRRQVYPHRELVISDDSTNSATERLVRRIDDPAIKYFKNSTNVGFSSNFRLSLERASGDVLLTLGDDDAFLSERALAVYAEVFSTQPTVAYAYANLVQFNNDLKIEFVNDVFTAGHVIAGGDTAIREIWTTSVFIAGMALRRSMLDISRYPDNDMLFPQVKLIGELLARYDGFGIAETLIAGRAHDDQLGFHAIRGERIKAAEKHGTIELFDILDELRAEHGITLAPEYLSERLTRDYTTMVMKERIVVGRRRVLENYRSFVERRPEVGDSKVLKGALLFSLLSPRWVLIGIRSMAIAVRRRRSPQRIEELEGALRAMLS